MIETMNQPRAYNREASKVVLKVLSSKPRRIYTSGEPFDTSKLEVQPEVIELSSREAYEEYKRYKEQKEVGE